MRYSISDVAETLDLDREVVRGLVKFLETIEECEAMGTRPPEAGRGRAETVYEFREGFEDRVRKMLKSASLAD